ncbi:Uncharacterized membrane protein [Belnapia rosea]|uniref:Uncharacterized membrane protein n=2 Tax=Belnapia rosea TaxID=938405 RepID=A0A1G7DZV1_9PROT|nr:Uncharacterized membrane protein [Belnapia rosea]
MQGGMLKNRLLAAWDQVRTSLWLLPLLMAAAGVGLAWAMLEVDAGHGAEDEVRAWWMNAGGAQDAQTLLSTLLTGVIAMAAMVFSATVVALTLAANQYGPRLVRVFRADLTTQVALGTFATTIVYLVLVLRMIRGDAAFHDVPHASVSIGTALALACVLALLVFIQEVARMAVADDVVERVGRELDAGIDRLPVLTADEGQEHHRANKDGADRQALWEGAGHVAQRQEGYVQAIDHEGLLAWAERHDAVLRLNFRAGDFVVAGDRRIHVHPPEAVEAAEADAICKFVVVGRERTPTQDIEFAVRHLVEVAVRALSPGINDPFTAAAVIDRLRGCLTRLAGRRLPSRMLRDGAGRVRILRETTTFAGLSDAAFHQIRQAAASHPAVVIHLVEAIARIAEHARTAEQRGALTRHARMVAGAGLRAAEEPGDRHDIERSLARAEQALADHGEALQPSTGHQRNPPGSRSRPEPAADHAAERLQPSCWVAKR